MYRRPLCSPRSLLALPLAAGLLALTGCGGGMGGGGLLSGLFTGGGGGFLGGGGGGLLGGGPPGLGGPGASGGPPPSSMLPPPGGVAPDAAKVFQKYGIQIFGAGATPPMTQQVANALRHYSIENTRGLTHFNVTTRNTGSLAGLWQMSGGRANITLYVKSYGVSDKTIIHELGHHWSLAADRQGGNALDQALPGSGGYVSAYSRTSRSEKLAEGVAWYLLSGAGKFRNTLSTWRPTEAGKQVVQTRIVANRPSI